MIRIDIPNLCCYDLEHLVLDYNGTLACDGQLISGVLEQLNTLAIKLNVHIITADTFGTVKNTFSDIDIDIKVINGINQGQQKANFINQFNPKNVVAIGNGANDAQMLKLSALGIALIQTEGAAIQSILNADIACTSITDALNLLLNPKRIAATLRI